VCTCFWYIPTEYILPNKLTFNSYYYSLFILEFSVLLAVLGAWRWWRKAPGEKIYWHLFFASALYLLAYQWLNAALEREEYYSGSYYDVPNYAAICWFILIAVRARNVPSEPLTEGEREHAADVPEFWRHWRCCPCRSWSVRAVPARTRQSIAAVSRLRSPWRGFF